jgi:hypothetical protein
VRVVGIAWDGAGTTDTMPDDPPICPSCGQPGTRGLDGDGEWECDNEACPEFGQHLRADEAPPPDEP